jgi:hypothetical protein
MAGSLLPHGVARVAGDGAVVVKQKQLLDVTVGLGWTQHAARPVQKAVPTIAAGTASGSLLGHPHRVDLLGLIFRD